MTDTYQKSELFNLVDRVYAQALLELAETLDQVDWTASQMQDLASLLDAEPDVIRLLASRTLALTERDQACIRAFENRVSPLVLRFIRLLVKKNRFDELPGIARAFLVMVDEKHGDIQVQAHVACVLPHDLEVCIIQRVSELTGRRALLHQHPDASLIGGVKLRVHDAILDGSVATQLRLLREQLIESGRLAARNSRSVNEGKPRLGRGAEQNW